MKDRDYLWCLVNLVLDGEEEREALCPTCRARAEEERCPVCGDPAARREAGTNPNFDPDRFARQKGGQA
jgi:predicted amidophosphoribosyltransferase